MQDIDKIGKKYDIKNVADGYAKNFLIPKGLVKLATEKVVEWTKLQKEIMAQKAEETLKDIQKVASALDGREIVFSVKTGEEGQLFESIGTQKIAEKIKELGFDVKKSQILLKKPIKEAGEFPIKINFDHNLEAEIKLVVAAE